MRDFADRVKRLLVGRPVPSRALGETLLPKRIALPVFASDALSSVGYAPDEVLITLAVAGSAATVISPWVALAVIGVLVVVVASYRQTVHAYPSGGGDYEVVRSLSLCRPRKALCSPCWPRRPKSWDMKGISASSSPETKFYFRCWTASTYWSIPRR